MEQIRQKLITEGRAKPSKIKSVMKWWSKRISMVIAKMASRNVAFKSDKLAEAVFQGKSVVQTVKSQWKAYRLMTLASKIWDATRTCILYFEVYLSYYLIRTICRIKLLLISTPS